MFGFHRHLKTWGRGSLRSVHDQGTSRLHVSPPLHTAWAFLQYSCSLLLRFPGVLYCLYFRPEPRWRGNAPRGFFSWKETGPQQAVSKCFLNDLLKASILLTHCGLQKPHLIAGLCRTEGPPQGEGKYRARVGGGGLCPSSETSLQLPWGNPHTSLILCF